MRLSLRFALALAVVLLAGCSTSPPADENAPPDALTVERPDYNRAFDAAIALARDEDLPVELRDRDGGVIETRADISGSLIEPWGWARNDFGAAVESTIMFQRRRARFEFVPAGFVRPAVPEEGPLIGQRVPGSVPSDANGAVDLTSYEGPIELRIWVFVERAFTPGLQRSTWTLTQTSFSTNPLKHQPVGDGTTRDRSIWTPLERDHVMERDLMEKLKERMKVVPSASQPKA